MLDTLSILWRRGWYLSVLESPALFPCLRAAEFRSRSACWASLMGSWFSYSADIVIVLHLLLHFVFK